ncbi:MAG: hypothetical protein AAF222_10425 [Pseudomonadota bacterium]
MNKSEVVFHLVAVISQRFPGFAPDEVERKLMQEGWPLGAIREALKTPQPWPRNATS